MSVDMRTQTGTPRRVECSTVMPPRQQRGLAHWPGIPLPSRSPKTAVTKSGVSEWEERTADATAHVIEAFRDLKDVRPEALGAEGARIFEELSYYLYSTLVGLDELALTMWTDGRGACSRKGGTDEIATGG